MTDIREKYLPFSQSIPSDDSLAFDDYIVKSVEPASDGDGWWVATTESWNFFVPNIPIGPLPLPDPEPGDEVRVYGGMGRPIQGFVLNGQVVFYRDAADREAYRRKVLAELKADREERFERERAELDAIYEALPPVFRTRVDRLRAKGGREFRVSSEGYETFILSQAALLADHFSSVEELLAWDRINSQDNEPPYDYDEQMRRAPKGWLDGHSGNTHAAAIQFAAALLRGETEF